MGKKGSIESKLSEFRRMVDKDYPVEKMLLFGSRARGDAKEGSDIDLIIVSSRFRKLNFIERGARMYDYWKIRMPVDFLCFTPSEFDARRKGATIVTEALREGIEIN